jgi:hypothetical protein
MKTMPPNEQNRWSHHRAALAMLGDGLAARAPG